MISTPTEITEKSPGKDQMKKYMIKGNLK